MSDPRADSKMRRAGGEEEVGVLGLGWAGLGLGEAPHLSSPERTRRGLIFPLCPPVSRRQSLIE